MLIINQNISLFAGYIFILWNLFFIENGSVIIIRIDSNNASTPPNFLGIDRKIA